MPDRPFDMSTEENFFKGIPGRFTDKNGVEIKLGDKAIVTDRDGKDWHGKIVLQDIPTIHTYNNGEKYENRLAFHSNYNITLWQYWTKKKLRLIYPGIPIIEL
jgi:hypothetical protein